MTQLLWVKRSFVAFHETAPADYSINKHIIIGSFDTQALKYNPVLGNTPSQNIGDDTDYLEFAVTAMQFARPADYEALENVNTERGPKQYLMWNSVSVPDGFVIPDIGGGTTNHSPTAVADNNLTAVGGIPTTFNVLANDTDPDGDSLTITAITVSTSHGTLTISSDRKSVVYTGATNFTGTDTFAYSISDNRGGTSATGAAINVTQTNHNPVAFNDTITVPSHTNSTVITLNPLGVNGNSADYDPDQDPILINSFPTRASHGSLTLASDGRTLSYTPDAGALTAFTGDSFTYTIKDNRGGISNTATFTINFQPNRAPVAFSDTATVKPGNTVSINAVANDTDADGDALTITGISSAPQHGTYTISADKKSINYTAATGYEGPDALNYTVSDGFGGTATGTVSITVAYPKPVISINPDAIPDPKYASNSLIHARYEGDPRPTGVIDFVVKSTGAHLQPITVRYDTAGGNIYAVEGEDFIGQHGTITFPATTSDTPQTELVSVQLISDRIAEGDGDIDFTLSNATNAVFEGGQTTLRHEGVIIDDDGPSDPAQQAHGAAAASQLEEAADHAAQAALKAAGKVGLKALAAIITVLEFPDTVKAWGNSFFERLRAPIKNMEDQIDLDSGGSANSNGQASLQGLSANSLASTSEATTLAAAAVAASSVFSVWLGSGYTGKLLLKNPDGSVTTAYVTGVLSDGIGPTFAQIAVEIVENNVIVNKIQMSYDGVGSLTPVSPSVFSSLVGDAPAAATWQYDFTTHQVTQLVSSADITAKLNTTASRLGLDIANPIGFTFVGDKNLAKPDDGIIGGSGNDNLSGLTGKDVLIGLQGDDILTGGPGNDVIDGGPGVDKAVYGALAATYTVTTYNDVVYVLTGGTDGKDQLQGVENIQFTDKTIAASTAAPFDPWEYLASNGDLIRAIGANPQGGLDHYIGGGFLEGRSTNSFDALEYVASNGDLIRTVGLNLLAAEQHYVMTGFNEGRATRSFDALRYVASNTDLIGSLGFDLVGAQRHYVTNGFKEGRPATSFDPLEYLASNVDLLRSLGLNSTAATQHYISNGFREGRSATSFDPLEYLASNPDLIRTIGPDPAAAFQHFLHQGYNEGRPTASFDGLQYLASNVDLLRYFGLNVTSAKQHYVQFGFKEGRGTSFDSLEYLASNTDLIRTYGFNPAAAFQHFLHFGYLEGRATASFDPLQYLALNTDLLRTFGVSAVAAEKHYVQVGYSEGRRAASFDSLEYLASNPDLIRTLGLNTTAALQHFVNQGFIEGRATASFDPLLYLASNTDLIGSLGLNPTGAFQHFLHQGYKEGRTTASFDPLEYLASNPDLIRYYGVNKVSAEQHFIQFGFREGRSTHSFDALEYLASNADLIQVYGFNPGAAFQHYLQYGYNEARATASFDPIEYLASNTDLIRAFGFNAVAAQQHYVQAGFNEHRPTTSFDPIEYLASNPDLIRSFGLDAHAAEQHYVQLGFSEGRATTSFDPLEYLASNTDLIRFLGLDPAAAYQHFLHYGFNEGRATASFNAAQYLGNNADLYSFFGNNLVAARQHYITAGINEGRTDKAPVINGDGGNNTLVAKNGAIMSGGGGSDTFVFNFAPLTPATVTDFTAGADHLQISASGFGHGLVAGGTAALVTAATVSAATHGGTDGYFIFDSNHTVWWDPTGGSGSDAIALTKLSSLAALNATDFLLA